jgi:hypothetical protein
MGKHHVIIAPPIAPMAGEGMSSHSNYTNVITPKSAGLRLGKPNYQTTTRG